MRLHRNSRRAVPHWPPRQCGVTALLPPFPAALPILDEQERLIPLIVATALFMENMDATVIATSAAGDRGGYWGAAPDAENCHHLVSAVAGGIYSGERLDRRSFGARMVFSIAIGVFIVGSIGCALPPSVNDFVIARIVQGFGGAMNDPGGRLVLLPLDRQEARWSTRWPGLRCRRWSDRDRAAARRLHHDLPDLALDLPDQHPDRAARHRDGAALHRPDPQRGPRALRSLWIGAGRDRAWRHRVRTFRSPAFKSGAMDGCHRPGRDRHPFDELYM